MYHTVVVRKTWKMTSTTEYVSMCLSGFPFPYIKVNQMPVLFFFGPNGSRTGFISKSSVVDLLVEGAVKNSLDLFLWLIPEYCWFNHLFSLVASDPSVSFRHLIFFTVPSTPDCQVIGFLALISVCPGSENKQIYSSTASLEHFVVFSYVQLRKQWTLSVLTVTL